LGLTLYDQLTGATDRASVARDYFSGFFSEKLMELNEKGEITAVPLYYDPNIDHAQSMGNLIGLGVAWYILPYAPELAYKLYSSAVRDLGLHDEEYNAKDRAPFIAITLTFHQLALALSLEFGDRRVEARLRSAIEVFAEPRNFGDGDFGFFYHCGERWPRGQLSALLMVAEVGAVGSWRRIFNNKGFRDRFSAPAVVGVNFPKLGISQAWNDPKEGTLIVSTYAATPSLRGMVTSFRVIRAPATCDLQVKRDGQVYDDWLHLGDGSVEVKTIVDNHTFVIRTGYVGPTGVDGVAVAETRRSKL